MARATKQDNPDARMSLGAHFRELRNRLLVSSIFVVAGAVVGWYFYDAIIDFISEPVTRARSAEGGRVITLNFNSLTGAFAMQMKVAIFSGILLASPIWIWQAWAFLIPGLTAKERRLALSYFFAAIPLFLLGALMAAFTFPRLYGILVQFAPESFTNIQNADDYLSTILFFVLAFGLAFLLPVLLVGLNQLRILPAPVMLKSWRITLFLILIFSAFMTPDPSWISMLVMAAPIFALFWGAVGVSFIMERARKKRGDDPRGRYAGLSPDEPTPLA